MVQAVSAATPPHLRGLRAAFILLLGFVIYKLYQTLTGKNGEQQQI